MTTTDRGGRERQVHASVVIVSTLVWAVGAGVVASEMAEARREEARDAAEAARVPAPDATAAPMPATLASAASTPVVAARATAAAAPAPGLRPAPRPRRRVVVVRRSRAS